MPLSWSFKVKVHHVSPFERVVYTMFQFRRATMPKTHLPFLAQTVWGKSRPWISSRRGSSKQRWILRWTSATTRTQLRVTARATCKRRTRVVLCVVVFVFTCLLAWLGLQWGLSASGGLKQVDCRLDDFQHFDGGHFPATGHQICRRCSWAGHTLST